jgi:hypothetical protein
VSAASELYQCLQTPPSNFSGEDWLVHHTKSVWQGVERVHFDFKEKRDRRNASLDDDDKKNLAKAISGFANSGGGVVIWGITDTGDKAPISNVVEFLQKLLEMCSHVTDPTVIGIDGTFIPSSTSQSDGYALLYVPESTSQPHRVIIKLKDLNGHYYVRSGSSFEVASHVQLEDMFGRRPKPKLEIEYRINLRPSANLVDLSILLTLHNRGRALAKYPYVALTVNSPYYICNWGCDGNGKTGLPTLAKEDPISPPNLGTHKGHLRVEFGSQGDLVIHSGASVKLTLIKGESLVASELPTLSLKCEVAAEGCPVVPTVYEISPSELLHLTTSREAVVP